MRDQDLLRRFLLGELAEDEAERLERRLLQEEEVQEEGEERFTLFDLCEAIEGDLLNAHARGELTPAESERLLKRLAASPGGRARIALARQLAGSPETARTEPAPAPLPFRRASGRPSRPAARWAALAAGLLLVLGGGPWMVLRLLERPAPGGHVENAYKEAPQPASPRVEAPAEPARPAAPEEQLSERPAPSEPAPEPDRPAAPEPAPRLATAVFELALSTLRSSNEPPQHLTVPKGIGQIEIQLDLGGEEESYRTFNALVKASGAGEVWSRRGLEPKPLDWGTVLILEIPADKLPDGRYEMEVQGVTAAGEAERIGVQEFEIAAD
jgi:hypothetical protein